MAKNSKIWIQRRTEGQAADGQPIEAWTNVTPTKVWAEIRDISGREFVAAGAEQAEVTTRIRIWRRDEVTAAMRVLHGAVVYDIKAPLLEGTDTTLLMCTRRPV